MSATTSESAVRKLWDIPTRVMHWALVILMLVSWLTAGENMQVHRWSGYGVLGLLVFRIWWGVAGSSSSRFASFIKGPGATLAYIRTIGQRKSADLPGHNPVGAWSVVLMLLLLLAQVVLGLFASDIDGLESGPLTYLVDFDTSRVMAEWHELTFRVLQVVIGIHIVAALFYLLYKRQNLIGAMITGRRRMSGEAAEVTFAPFWRVAVGIILSVLIVWAVAKGLRF
jgi:cytochrome b